MSVGAETWKQLEDQLSRQARSLGHDEILDSGLFTPNSAEFVAGIVGAIPDLIALLFALRRGGLCVLSFWVLTPETATVYKVNQTSINHSPLGIWTRSQLTVEKIHARGEGRTGVDRAMRGSQGNHRVFEVKAQRFSEGALRIIDALSQSEDKNRD